MRRNTKLAIAALSLIVILPLGSFILVPVVSPTNYTCAGGLACVNKVSYSCEVLGFGAYTIGSGLYFFTFHCPVT